jgi:hypothetical protein
MVGRRKFLRFSLRTAFLLVTLLCIWCAFLGYRYRAQRSAANTIEQLGGFVAWKEPGPKWLKNLIGHDPFAYVWEAGFVGVPIEAEALSSFRQLYALHRVAIAQNKSFSGDGLQHLTGLDHLRSIYLYEVPVTDEGLKNLPSLAKLEELYILATRVSDKCTEQLEKLRTVKVIQLGSEQLTEAAVRDLGKRLPNAKVVWSGQGFDDGK